LIFDSAGAMLLVPVALSSDDEQAAKKTITISTRTVEI
jgi:hypothetical protein